MYIYRFHDIDNNIIYVGKAKDLLNRMKGHKHIDKKCYDSVTYIDYIKTCSDAETRVMEEYYINYYKPKYNQASVWEGKINIKVEDQEWKPLSEFNYNDGRMQLLRKEYVELMYSYAKEYKCKIDMFFF